VRTVWIIPPDEPITGNERKVLALCEVDFKAEFIGRTANTAKYPEGLAVETWRSENHTVHVVHQEDKATMSALVWPMGNGMFSVIGLSSPDQVEYEVQRSPPAFTRQAMRQIVDAVMSVIAGHVDTTILKEDV